MLFGRYRGQAVSTPEVFLFSVYRRPPACKKHLQPENGFCPERISAGAHWRNCHRQKGGPYRASIGFPANARPIHIGDRNPMRMRIGHFPETLPSTEHNPARERFSYAPRLFPNYCYRCDIFSILSRRQREAFLLTAAAIGFSESLHGGKGKPVIDFYIFPFSGLFEFGRII